MTAVRRLVRHFLLNRRHVPRHAKPEPLAPFPMGADDSIAFADYRHPYSPKDAA